MLCPSQLVVEDRWIGLRMRWCGAGCGDDEGETSVSVQLQRLSQGICVHESYACDEEPTTGTQSTAGTFEIDQEGVNVVRLLSQNTFNAKLIIHPNIAWAKKELK